MSNWNGKRYWIVGASEGLGAALAREMSAAGADLVLSARSEERLKTLAADLPGPCTVVSVDVRDQDSVNRAAAQADDIDGIVYLAGVYWPQAAPDWNAEQVTAMCDVNFTGAARVLSCIVPKMAARGTGHIVLTGSLSGFRGLPGATGYAASKAGVMAMAEALHADLRGTGVKVQLVNPGFIRTRLTDKNDFRMPFIMDPEKAADIVLAHMKTDRFQKSFPRPFSWVFRLSLFLPDWLYFRIFA